MVGPLRHGLAVDAAGFDRLIEPGPDRLVDERVRRDAPGLRKFERPKPHGKPRLDPRRGVVLRRQGIGTGLQRFPSPLLEDQARPTRLLQHPYERHLGEIPVVLRVHVPAADLAVTAREPDLLQVRVTSDVAPEIGLEVPEILVNRPCVVGPLDVGPQFDVVQPILQPPTPTKFSIKIVPTRPC